MNSFNPVLLAPAKAPARGDCAIAETSGDAAAPGQSFDELVDRSLKSPPQSRRKSVEGAQREQGEAKSAGAVAQDICARNKVALQCNATEEPVEPADETDAKEGDVSAEQPTVIPDPQIQPLVFPPLIIAPVALSPQPDAEAKAVVAVDGNVSVAAESLPAQEQMPSATDVTKTSKPLDASKETNAPQAAESKVHLPAPVETPTDNAVLTALKAPIPAEAVSSEPTPVETAPDASPEPRAIPPPESSGISGAKTDVPMKKDRKENEFTGLPEQKLPTMASAVDGENLPARPTRVFLSPAQANRTAPAVTAENVSVHVSAPVETAATQAAVTIAESPASARLVERTHDMVAVHAMRLRESTADSLHVVIKPGSGLQLSLELRRHDNGIEVQATLERGDFSFLNRHWHDLQQQLEARGVKVSPLISEEFTANGGERFSKPNHQETRDEFVLPGLSAATVRGTVAVAATAPATVAPRRGFESWA